MLDCCVQMGGKKITRAGGSKHRAKRASIESMNIVRSMDYGTRASAPAPAPVPVPAPAPNPGPATATDAALIPAPAPGAVNPPAVAAVGKDLISINISEA